MIFLGAILGVSFSFAQYLPSPPPPSAIRYAPPQQSTTSIPPPPGGWTQSRYSSNYPSSFPIPPPDPKLKDFNLDLDLNDFAGRNQFPTEHCFFRVKGRKDIVEFIPDQLGGMLNFPTGTCNLEEEKCYISKRNARLPRMKKNDPPIYGGMTESKSRDFAVIPYKYADDIDFSKCVASWTGFFEADDYKVHLYKSPKRDYSEQSCYHPRRGLTMDPKSSEPIFCDKKKCQLTENQYCENKTGQCYLNEYPLKTKKGKSVTTDENYLGINWNFCTNEDGTLIPEDGGIPYEERFKPGCSYKVTAPNYHEKQYVGNIDFLIKCDENRCSFPGLDFDMKKKQYYRMDGDKMVYTNTPTIDEILTVDWTCLDASRVPDFNKKLLCRFTGYDEQGDNCELCYENKKFVYKGCGYKYDELGQRLDIPKELRDYDLFEQARLLPELMQSLENDGEISWKTARWFEAFFRATDILGHMVDKLQRHRLAFRIAQFRKLTNPTEANAGKLKNQISPFLVPEMKKEIDRNMKNSKDGQCMICRTSTAEARLSSPIREACAVCNE